MRLLFLSERFPPDLGGVATSAGRIASALAGLGAAVDVVAWTRSLDAGVVVEEPGNPRVFRMGRFREWDSTMPHTLNLLDWLRSSHSYDGVWGHYLAPAGFLATWFGRRHGIRSTVSIRGNDLDRDMFAPGDFARLVWTLENTDCISAVSEDLAAKVTALCGRTDVAALSNVVDPATFVPAAALSGLREKLGIQPGEVVLGFAGELREKKGQQFLLQALREVRASRPACLLVIGEVRPSEMPKLLPWLGPGSLAEQRILVTGQLAAPAQVNEHLHLCDVYLQPSLWDGMPNALLEAMAAGCACIASDAGGIPEIIRNEVDGIILRRWELQRLSQTILDLLDKPANLARMRVAGRARVASHFTASRERQQLQVILARLMPSSS